MDHRTEPEILAPVEIPVDQISAQALDGLIEEFILREGTDYGAAEVSLAAKKQQIHRQIEDRRIKIVFDLNTESVTLLPIVMSQFSPLRNL